MNFCKPRTKAVKLMEDIAVIATIDRENWRRAIWRSKASVRRPLAPSSMEFVLSVSF